MSELLQMQEPPLVQAENLSKSYRSGVDSLTVFSGLQFDIHAGERLAIVGESGVGKSTLLHLIGGLDRPSAGRVLYRGEPVSELSDTALADYRNRHIGFVWQIHHLLPEFTAAENVFLPLLIRGVSRPNAEREAMSRLADVGLAARANHRAGELSGGERQRVVLARALVTRPALLLADEPTGNLDQRTGENVFALIEDLHTRFGLTSVCVTHNVAFAARCDRVLRLQNGTLFEESRGSTV
jgi:lipoprotein-releasing system ATP-binding protein